VLDIIGNENVVEDCAGLDLPQIEPELAVLVELADVLGVICVVFGVSDDRVLP
jgi:hypothetical protein